MSWYTELGFIGAWHDKPWSKFVVACAFTFKAVALFLIVLAALVYIILVAFRDFLDDFSKKRAKNKEK